MRFAIKLPKDKTFEQLMDEAYDHFSHSAYVTERGFLNYVYTRYTNIDRFKEVHPNAFTDGYYADTRETTLLKFETELRQYTEALLNAFLADGWDEEDVVTELGVSWTLPIGWTNIKKRHQGIEGYNYFNPIDAMKYPTTMRFMRQVDKMWHDGSLSKLIHEDSQQHVKMYELQRMFERS